MTKAELDREQDQDSSPDRASTLQEWFQSLLPELTSARYSQDFIITVIRGDASFRRYYRADNGFESYVLVDAPPDQEDSHIFVNAATVFRDAGVNVPEVYKADFEQGFMCLSDLGDTLLWEQLKHAQQQRMTSPDASDLYRLAFSELLKIQHSRPEGDKSFPVFGAELLLQEMCLFRDWFCGKLLEMELDEAELKIFDESFRSLTDAAIKQKQVPVHRDFHSRNLLFRRDNTLGVIDFQDAVIGPFTYDLVSLLKDCYIAWPRSQVNNWAMEYLELAAEEQIIDFDPIHMLAGFDLMGAQRHLKAIGIFARLYLRDGKPGYLADIPRTLSYLREVARDYESLHPFSDWMERKVVPFAENRIHFILTRGGG